MYITNSPNCASDGVWEAYSTSKSSWTLAQTNGTATVYAKFRNTTLNGSSCVSDLTSGDTITHYTDSVCSTPTLKATCSASGATMSLTSSTLSPDGAFTFYALATDPAGNSSNCSTANVAYTLDTAAPTATSISITAGTTYTNTSSVALTLAATGATEMHITNTSDCAAGGTWETYTTKKLRGRSRRLIQQLLYM